VNDFGFPYEERALTSEIGQVIESLNLSACSNYVWGNEFGFQLVAISGIPL
jgi:hypothetical protein